jgi:hypothetical protein
MSKLLDQLLYKHSSDQVKILLDRMDTHPECFSKQRVGTWEKREMNWLDIAKNGTFHMVERCAINRKLKRIDLKYSRDRILDILMNGDDPYTDFLRSREEARNNGNPLKKMKP